VAALEQVEDPEYAREMVALLKRVVARYDQAVFVTRSREQAAAAVDELSEWLDNVNAAATRGGMEIFGDSILAEYGDLQPIFRETRYRHPSL